jgi:hypothetical protein
LQKLKIEELNEGDVVYYIPQHLEKTMKNADRGIITKIKDGHVWVRFRGPTGALTPVDFLYR